VGILCEGYFRFAAQNENNPHMIRLCGPLQRMLLPLLDGGEAAVMVKVESTCL
jgi:hypothetical protein